MKPRLLIALAIVLALVFGAGLLAVAGEDDPSCWWFSYTVEMRGKNVLKVPNTCIPCLAVCDLLPPPPGAGSRSSVSGTPR
jgi:hypothetical protein